MKSRFFVLVPSLLASLWIPITSITQLPAEEFGPVTVVVSETTTDFQRVLDEASGLLAAKRYDQIEQRVQALRQSAVTYPHGGSQLMAFMYGLFMPRSRSVAADADYKQRIAELRAWREARTNAIAPRVALAWALEEGSRWVRGFLPMEAAAGDSHSEATKYLNEALALAEAGRKATNEADLWYAVSLWSAGTLRLPPAEMDRLFQEAVKSKPNTSTYYFIRAYYLLPAKGGEPGATESFMEESTNRLGGDAGDIVYARIVWGFHERRAFSNIYQQLHISWDRVKRGHQALLKAYPHSLDVLSEFAYQAYKAGDYVTACNLFRDEIKDQAELSTWGTAEHFDEVRRYVCRKANSAR